MKFSLDTTTIFPEKDQEIKNAIILLHGYGGDGKDISALSLNWKRFLPNTIFLCPNGHEIWLNDVRHLDFKHDILIPDNTKEMRLVFGGASDGKADFHGKLDEIAFFDRALTSKQIKTLYKSSIP